MRTQESSWLTPPITCHHPAPKVLRGAFEQQVPAKDAASRRWAQLVRGDFGWPDPTPIFIVGMPRSGSSLLESMLAAHPAVWGAGEDTALARLVPQLVDLLATGRWQAQPERVKELGRAYVEAMRDRVPPSRNVSRIVDKLLFNAW